MFSRNHEEQYGRDFFHGARDPRNKYIRNLGSLADFPSLRFLKRSHGYRNRNRTLLRRKPRDRGKIALGRLLINYQLGQRVRIMINPAVQKGMPHRRYHGRVGAVMEKRGRAYVIEVSSGSKYPRQIIARPEHIELVEETS